MFHFLTTLLGSTAPDATAGAADVVFQPASFVENLQYMGIGMLVIFLVIGLILAVLAAFVLFGGIKRLGSVTEKLVPGMAVVYIVACLAVVVFSASSLPAIFNASLTKLSCLFFNGVIQCVFLRILIAFTCLHFAFTKRICIIVRNQRFNFISMILVKQSLLKVSLILLH